jgi:hypothetical protein
MSKLLAHQIPLPDNTPAFIEGAKSHAGEWAFIDADVDGGSLAVERDVGNGTFVAYPDSPIAADGGFEFRLTGGAVRLTNTGGGATSTARVGLCAEGNRPVRHAL